MVLAFRGRGVARAVQLAYERAIPARPEARAG